MRRKNGKNKLKWWKFTNNGYPAHHLCAQILANPHQGDTKIKHFFEDGEIIYNMVFPVTENISGLPKIFVRKRLDKLMF